jgi:tRNA(Ile)-lysidine synthetase-like protein
MKSRHPKLGQNRGQESSLKIRSGKGMPQGLSSKTKPGPVGGLLIRRWIRLLDQARFERSIDSQILCAVSGGADSTALAVLTAKYGKRLGRLVGLLHVNHGWRGEESDGDEAFVQELADRLSVPCWVKRGTPAPRGSSPEAHARRERREFFIERASQLKVKVLTAHHADDLAETVLWRLMTGAAATHGAGIRVLEDIEIRPCLTTHKRELEAFLIEEKMDWREDRTNTEGVLLRSKMRASLLPQLDQIFPKWRQHLCAQALSLQWGQSSQTGQAKAKASILDSFFADLLAHQGVRVRRAHLAAIRAAAGHNRTIALEGGLKLTHEWSGPGRKSRWILE